MLLAHLHFWVFFFCINFSCLSLSFLSQISTILVVITKGYDNIIKYIKQVSPGANGWPDEDDSDSEQVPCSHWSQTGGNLLARLELVSMIYTSGGVE